MTEDQLSTNLPAADRARAHDYLNKAVDLLPGLFGLVAAGDADEYGKAIMELLKSLERDVWKGLIILKTGHEED